MSKRGRPTGSTKRCPYSRSTLRLMYEDNAMAISEIANDLGHCNGTIARWLREAGIAIRSQGGANNPWGNPGKRKVA